LIKTGDGLAARVTGAVGHAQQATGYGDIHRNQPNDLVDINVWFLNFPVKGINEFGGRGESGGSGF
jgi:hypothetical protein